MASITEQQPEYVPEKPVFENDRLHFVSRVADGDRYLAQKYDLSDFPELLHLREEKPDDKIISFEAAARVLNHENLISVVKPMTIPTDSASSRRRNKDFFLLHEFCADGNLARLFDKPPVEVVTNHGFLPEGLVWHVALSMLRALTFLHEGWREKIVLSKEDDTVVRDWYCPDDDWMPILHRSIRPENIHFQARKGKESYGLCKLGDFSRCVVAGTARVPTDDNLEVVAVLNNPGEDESYEASQEQIRELWHAAHEKVSIHYPDCSDSLTYGRIYTTGSELADLGAILYRMMKGETLEVDICDCGCLHIDANPPGCQCDCPIKDVHLERSLLDSKYSGGLLQLVAALIRSNRDSSARAFTRYCEAWKLYRTWKEETIDGRAHLDHYDDLVARKKAEKRRNLEVRSRELGDGELAAQEIAAREKDEDLLVWN